MACRFNLASCFALLTVKPFWKLVRQDKILNVIRFSLTFHSKVQFVIKVIVHQKMKIVCLSAYPMGIQDVGNFVSSVEHKRKFLTQTVAVCPTYNGCQWYSRLWEKKNIHRQNQIKPCSSWQYIEVWRHETIGLCKKLKSIYIYFFTSDTLTGPTVLSSFTQQPALDSYYSSCFTGDRRLLSALQPPISQMDHWYYIYNLS